MRLKTLTLLAGAMAAALRADAQPPTTRPNPDGPRITWPDGWVSDTPTKPATKQIGNNAALDAGALLAEVPVSDYADGLSIADLAGHQIERIKSTTAFKTAKFTSPVQRKVGGRDATVVEADVVVKSIKFHYQFTFIKVGDFFCTVYLWSVPSKWSAAATQAGPLVAALH